MRKNKGASLSQYALIIALIAIALVPVFLILGKSIFSHFEHFSDYLKNKDTSSDVEVSSTSTTTSTDLKGGALGGTSDKPVKECVDSVCTVDYGEFILQGIPADVSDFIQSSGTSGDTSMFADLLDQLAYQLAEKGDVEAANAFKDLANIEHYTADIQEVVETIASSCDSRYATTTSTSKDVFASSCFTNALRSASMPKIPEDIKHLLGYDYSISGEVTVDDMYQVFTKLSDYGDLGAARYEKMANPEAFDKDLMSKPSYAAINVMDKILANPDYSNNMKGVTAAILNNLNILGVKMEATIVGIERSGELTVTAPEMPTMPVSSTVSAPVAPTEPTTPNIASSLLQPVSETPKVIRDVVTGEELQVIDYEKSSLEDIIKAEAALQSDYYAGVVCETGYNEDNGYKCNSK